MTKSKLMNNKRPGAGLGYNMKILEIGPYPPSYGGWSRRIKALREGLIRQGHECMVLNLGKGRWPPTSEYDGFRNRLHFFVKVWSYSRRGFALHVHINAKSLHQLTVALVCRTIAGIWRNRMVLTVHAGQDQKYLCARSWLLRVLVRLILRMPDHVICDSELVRASIIKAGGIPYRVTAISPFTRQYLDGIRAPTGVLAEFAQSHRPLLLCYAYVLDNEPTLHALVEAVLTLRNDLPQVGVVLFGNNQVEDAWRNLELDEAMADCVFWCGSLPAPQFLGLMQESDVFVRSSSTDGVAASVLEALALGVPVVASRLEGRPAGVIEYDLLDSADLAAKIRVGLKQSTPGNTGVEIPDTVTTEVSLLEAVCGS